MTPMTPENAPVIAPDPYQLTAGMPLHAVFYPLGFPLQIETNHMAVLAAAGQSWDLFPPRFQEPPIKLRLAVSPDGDSPLAQPVFRAQGHLFSIVGDAANFAVVDYTQAFAFGWFTSAVAADPGWFRWYYLEALAYVLLAHLYVTPVHAACVARKGNGILLCGNSGAGKSSLAYACARRGWTFLSDDSVALVRARPGRAVIGKPYQFRFRDTAAALFPELGGLLASRHPNGKLTMEVPAAAFPNISIAPQCEAGPLVFLNRDGRRRASLSPLEPGLALARLAADMPLYHQPVAEAHRRSIETLVEAPCFELRYGDLDSAVSELESLDATQGGF